MRIPFEPTLVSAIGKIIFLKQSFQWIWLTMLKHRGSCQLPTGTTDFNWLYTEKIWGEGIWFKNFPKFLKILKLSMFALRMKPQWNLHFHSLKRTISGSIKQSQSCININCAWCRNDFHISTFYKINASQKQKTCHRQWIKPAGILPLCHGYLKDFSIFLGIYLIESYWSLLP